MTTTLDNAYLCDNSDDRTFKIDQRIAFCVGATEVMSFEANGDIFVRGEKVDSNQAVYEEFLAWLSSAQPLMRQENYPETTEK